MLNVFKRYKKAFQRITTVAMTSVMFFTSVGVPIASANPLLEDSRPPASICRQAIDDSRRRGELVNEGESDNGGLANVEAIYNFMHEEYGLSAELIAGILGNFKQESGINPRTVQGFSHIPINSSEYDGIIEQHTGNTNKGIGLGQWTFDRHTLLVEYGEEVTGSRTGWADLGVQLSFMFTRDSNYRLGLLARIARNSTDDVVDNTVLFHDLWEGSADSDAFVREVRGGFSLEIWDYMRAKGLTGGRDLSKINQIDGGGGGDSPNNPTLTGSGKVKDICDDLIGMSGNEPSGNIGETTIANGQVGSIIGGAWRYEQVPDELKQYIALPRFPDSYNFSFSPFNNSAGLRGQCTELTWVMMGELYDGSQPASGHGGSVWQSYQSAGADITNQPTVGYGFSASYPNAGASNSPYGHTGMVAGVLPDGSWIALNFNWSGEFRAPSRIPFYTHVAGSGTPSNPVQFFSGVGNPKFPSMNQD